MKRIEKGKYLFQYMDMFGVVTNFYDNISEVKKKIKKHSLHIDNNYIVFKCVDNAIQRCDLRG